MHVHVQLFCDPMDCSLPGSSVYGISQARLLESFSLSAKFVISSVLSCCSKNLKWRTYSVTAPCCSSALFANKGKYILEVWGQFSPVQSLNWMPNSLGPHGLQHTRPPCLSPSPAVYSNSCPLSRWCQPKRREGLNFGSSLYMFFFSSPWACPM